MVPPLVGIAVKVALVPEQILVKATMLTLAAKFGLTVIVTALDAAGEPVKQGDALLVIITVTESLLDNVVVE